MERILMASLFTEGMSFTTTLQDKTGFSILEGPLVLEKAAGSATGLGGALSYLQEHNIEMVPIFTAIAPPSGGVKDSVYQAFKDTIINAAVENKYDGIFLDLHGAMTSESVDDVEGDLLRSLRRHVGSEVVIAASLDLHAYVTRRMLNEADIVIACKHNPHTDYDLAGRRAAKLMLRTIRGEIKPVTASVWVPLLLGNQLETESGPLARLHSLRKSLYAISGDILDISLYNLQVPLDVLDGGQCVTVITDDNQDAAGKAAIELATELWNLRDKFILDNPSLEKVLGKIKRGVISRPAILGDDGDSVLGGTPGDGTFILNELLQNQPDLKALIPVTDPEVVAEAIRLGAGQVYSGPLGGKLSENIPSVNGEWLIRSLGDGHFIHDGPFWRDEPAFMGATAILEQNNVIVMVTSQPSLTQDPAAFRSQGLSIGDFDLVVVKSAHHFKISFDGIGHCVTVDTPGLTNYVPGVLPFEKLRPIYPEDAITTPVLFPEYF